MAKIYVKTIILMALFTTLLLARLGLLIIQLPIPVAISNFLLAIIPLAIIINEKLTKGERWEEIHYILLVICILFFAILFFKLI